MAILGIDAATHTTGIAIINDDGSLLCHRNILGGNGSARDRSLVIYDELCKLIEINPLIKAACLEDILLNKWVPNLNACRDLCILQGIIVSCLHKYKIPFDIMTANNWKSTIGIFTGPEGRTRQAQKDRAIKLVKDKYNIDVDDNQADAICIALSYLKIHSEDLK